MKLFLVGPTKHHDCDEYDSFVVRAENEEQARRVAMLVAEGWRPADVQLPERIKTRLEFCLYPTDNYEEFQTCPCAELTLEGPLAVILGSYNESTP
jgi:hypothetical protein